MKKERIIKKFKKAIFALRRQRAIFLTLFCISVISLGNSNAYAQETKTITGFVSEESGAALERVVVYAKNDLTTGQITGIDGKYQITVPANSEILVFKFVGMSDVEETIGTRSVINVKMSGSTALDEVVAIGYGTQKKSNITSAMTVVNSDVLENRPTTNLQTTLQGVAPGLNITASGFGGEPGQEMAMNIRGTGRIWVEGNKMKAGGEPYVLVDGLEMNINDVNPNDIESLTVLKDGAASAIYGARASFGVILITTKSGSRGAGTRVTYSHNSAWGTNPNKPTTVDAYDWGFHYRAAADNANAGYWNYTDEWMEKVLKQKNGEALEGPYMPTNPALDSWDDFSAWYYSTNQFDIIYDKYEYISNDNFSVSGGGKNSNYYFSGGYMNHNGRLASSYDWHKRYNVTANYNVDIKEWLGFDLKSKMMKNEVSSPQYDANVGNGYLYSQMIMPHMPITDENGYLLPHIPSWLAERYSPDKSYTGQMSNRNKLTYSYSNTFGLTLKPVDGLVIRGEYDINYTSLDDTREGFYQNIGSYRGDFAAKRSLPYNGEIETSLDKTIYQSLSTTANYVKSINEHNFDVLLGYEDEQYEYKKLWGKKRDFISSSTPSISTAKGDFWLDDALAHWSTRSTFGRLNYNYNSKYFLSATFRYDLSSKFEKGNRAGTFPSVSGGWNIARESFFANSKAGDLFDQLKLRGSWSKIGNHDVANYLYISSMTYKTQTDFILGGSNPGYIGTPALTSDDLTWETVKSTGLGIDVALLNNRLSGSFDWYIRATEGMFGPREPLPATLGTTVPKANAARQETKGWEFDIMWKDKIGDINYNLSFGISDYESVITDYLNESGTLSTWYEGKVVGEIWGYETDRYFTEADFNEDGSFVEGIPAQNKLYAKWTPGDVKYKDIAGGEDGAPDNEISTGDNTIYDHGDLKILGNSLPRLGYHIKTSVEWNGLELSSLWTGVGKWDWVAGGNEFWGLGTNIWSTYVMPENTDYWTPENTNAFLPKPYMSGETNKNRKVQSKYVLNRSYLKLKNLTLAYSIPKKYVNKLFMQNLRIFVSGENLWTITGINKPYDPEYMAPRNYAITRKYSLGVNVTL